jgi:hypothetical protein
MNFLPYRLDTVARDPYSLTIQNGKKDLLHTALLVLSETQKGIKLLLYLPDGRNALSAKFKKLMTKMMKILLCFQTGTPPIKSPSNHTN